MALNDTLTNDESQIWWAQEVDRQLRDRRRDNNKKDERAEETDE